MYEAIQSFHFSEILDLIPDSVPPLVITLVLSFLIGLEREEHSSEKFYNFGGVRTFPIIGLCGYLIASLAAGQALIMGAGVLVLGALLWLSYRKKLELSAAAGMTSEVSGLFTFLLGALIFHGALWEATTLAVFVLLLLELKSGLETLARKIPASEIFTFTRFLLISAVILPIVPNHEFTDLHFNPFHTWLIVVAISGLSYSAYVLGHLFGTRRSILLSAILGGIYSSTTTTIVLAKRSRVEKQNDLISGAIVVASGFMYFRLVVLICIFNWSLGQRLALALISLGIIFSAVGGLMILGAKASKAPQAKQLEVNNPLELKSALAFALIFSLMSILTAVVLQRYGSGGIYSLSFLTGLTDVDPFVMSLSQSAKTMLAESMAAKGIVIATASNNLLKGIYTAVFAADEVRKKGSLLLIILAFISLSALFFV